MAQQDQRVYMPRGHVAKCHLRPMSSAHWLQVPCPAWHWVQQHVHQAHLQKAFARSL